MTFPTPGQPQKLAGAAPRALRIGVMGAGAIGCYVGGCLAAEGNDVVFVGRERLKADLGASGLTVSGLDGERPRTVAKEKLVFATQLSALADRDVVLCCVKSAQSAEVAEQLASVLRPDAIVVSMQNGVRNADVLRAGLPNQTVLGGIVGFNVVSKDNGNFRQATSGPLVIEASSPADPRVAKLGVLLEATGLEVEITADIRAQQWSKLVMNLNNAVSALTDQPTKELLFGDGYRRSLAAIMEEAVHVLRKSGTRTARLGPLPIRLFPFVLRLPAPLLRLVAAAQVKVDAEARSSMWEDLSRGRKTEVDYLNGEIVRLAEASAMEAPLNARIVALIHEVEQRGEGSPKLSADALWTALTS
jgi:2-dehydropantoate 2-reductase